MNSEPSDWNNRSHHPNPDLERSGRDGDSALPKPPLLALRSLLVITGCSYLGIRAWAGGLCKSYSSVPPPQQLQDWYLLRQNFQLVIFIYICMCIYTYICRYIIRRF